MFRVLSNQHYQHRTNQKLRSKSWGLWASVSFFPLPLPCHSIFFFALVPTFLDELGRKRLLRRLTNRRVLYSRAAQNEYLFLRESEANAGHFSPRRETNVRKVQLSCRKKRRFETLKGFGGLKTYLRWLDWIFWG